jgi:8-oxo-dGTP pyrophosphatase MutT (NUDIX family)
MTKIDDTWYVRPADCATHVSTGGIVARAENGRALVALIRDHDAPDYVLPKGHVDPGETLEQAAFREIEEEAGFTELALVEKLGVCERLGFTKRSWGTFHYFLFTTTQINATPTDPMHPNPPEWFALDVLPDIFWPEQRDLILAHREKIEAAVS